VSELPLILGGADLTIADAAGFAYARRPVLLDDKAHAAIASSSSNPTRAAVYGRTTGVGANRDVPADDHDGMHGMRLLRSHATGAGPDLGADVSTTAMLIRAHQLAGGYSGIEPAVVEALVAALASGHSFPVRTFGGMGTGDIVHLAELALCLVGERPWHQGVCAYVPHFGSSSALAFMSSSAPTLAVASLALHECRALVSASIAVASIGAVAALTNNEHWSFAAVSTRPSEGTAVVARMIASICGPSVGIAARTQDPLSWRCMPFVAGALSDVMEIAEAGVTRALNANAENPTYRDDSVWHHGAFMLTDVALHLDTVRLAIVQWASTSVARLVKLHDPQYTELSRFLAIGPAGSSGHMVLEYTAGSALETVRTLADPSSRHTTSISLGNEDHASFASRSAIALSELLPAWRTVIACELLSALRALRMRPDMPISESLNTLVAVCDSLPAPGPDRVLIDEIAMADGVLDQLSSVLPLETR
jgi:histidine ammonia-lyase